MYRPTGADGGKTVKFSLDLDNPEATARLAVAIGRHLAPGDTLLLSGPIGVGKTHFARALIADRLARAGFAEDIPSPSYTLVQVYDDGLAALWHADLYRLGGPDETIELGLADAFESAIVLVEWPDRLAAMRPDRRLAIDIAAETAALGRRSMVLHAHGDWPWLGGVLAPFEARPEARCA